MVVNRNKNGVIGRVRATSRNGFPIKYKLISRHPKVRIRADNGAITMSYRSALSERIPIISTAFRVSAQVQLNIPRFSRNRFRATTWVRIITIRRYYGDKILQRVHRKLLIPTKMNHLSQTITPENLHRLVRMIPPKVNPFAAQMSAAQMSIDNACSRTLLAIKDFFKGK